jgi:nucleoside-diphosphate-sugar epimerase
VLVPLLLAQGYRVRVIDNLRHGGAGLLGNFHHRSFELVAADIRDPRRMADAMKGADFVIHLAAIVGYPACREDPGLAETVNVEGSKVVAAAAGRERPMLFASTCSVYGAVRDGVCTEETPLNPVSWYGKTKAAAEQQLLENCRTVTFRLATAFGVSPRMRCDLLLNHFVLTALRAHELMLYQPHALRAFVHVHDIARSFLFGIEHFPAIEGQVFNVGSEEMNYTKAQVCEMIQRQVAYCLRCAESGEDEDKRDYAVSCQKIKARGYNTTVSLEQGIEELVRAAVALPCAQT